MSRYHLSVLVPARNEFYYDIDLLYETVSNVLANTSDKTEIIVCLDGYWPKQPLPVNCRLTVLHHNHSIGQRAATNEAARVATGEYVMKLDAHCALDANFDEKLLATFEPRWTVVPAQYNLLVFNWKCRKCGKLKDQSPQPKKCAECGSRYLKQVKEWRPRDGSEGTDVDRPSGQRNTLLKSWRFDTKLEYNQWGELSKRQDGPIIDTMSLLGACWAMRRERYYEIEPCDPLYGSWGQMGTEIACKSILSGGELKTNTTTWFAHFFRVGGIGFPWPDGGRKERAMARCREQWLQNKWEGQKYPLSWMIEKFKPVPDWHTGDNPVLAQVVKAGKAFKSSVFPLVLDHAGTANPEGRSVREDGFLGREQVPPNAVSLTAVNGGNSVGPSQVIHLQDELQVGGIAARRVITDDMIQQGNISTESERHGTNQPSVHQARQTKNVVLQPSIAGHVGQSNLSVAVPVSTAIPDPATANRIDSNIREQTSDNFSTEFGNSEILLGSHDSASSAELRSGSESRVERDSGPLILPQKPRKMALYYSCLSHDELLESAARANLKRSTNGHEIGCVTLGQRVDFGDWNVVIDRQKSGATMHYQILAGLERSTADYVFLCESDVFYHRSHFEFVPPRSDCFYYNTNVWRVRYEDGHAVRTANLQQVSGICADRRLLLEHYRRRVEIIEQNGGKFDTKRMAYEPGTRGKLGDEHVANWESLYPNLDITGHGNTLTVPHFSRDSFRNKKYAEGWTETDEPLPGWPKIAGRVQEWLREMVDGG